MKNIIYIFLAVCLSTPALAQQIVGAEYFFDTDPGVGNGTSVPFSADDSLEFTASIPLNNLDAGFHNLLIRFKNELGFWSCAEQRSFFAQPLPMSNETIVAGEYFIDIEPGVGNGMPLDISSQADSIEQNYAITLGSLSQGFHQLGMRFKNQSGSWSALDARSFYVTSIQALDNNIVSGEYFVDVEPGVGNGTPFAVSSTSDSLEYDVSLLLPTMELGNHNLYIRYKNADNNWTLAEPRPFVVCTSYAAEADFTFNITDDLAFFDDNSQYADSLLWDFGDGATSTQVNAIHLYDLGGQYDVTQFNYNVCGDDAITKTIDINGAGVFTPSVSANTNYVVATITGAGFIEGSLAKLFREGEEILPTNINWSSSHHLTATFNFVSETIGDWNLAVEVPGVFLDTIFNAIALEPVAPINLSTYIVAPARQLLNRNQKVLVNISNDGNQTVFGLQNFVSFTKQNVSVALLSDLKAPSFVDHYLDSVNRGLVTSLDLLTQDSVYFGHYIIPMLGPGETTTLMFNVLATNVQPMQIQSVLANSIFSPTQVNSFIGGLTSFTPQGITSSAGRTGLATGGLLNNSLLTGLLSGLVTGTSGGSSYNSPGFPSPNYTVSPGPGSSGGGPPTGCVGCGNQGGPVNNGGTGPVSGGQQVAGAIFSPIMPNAPANPQQPFVPAPEDEEVSQEAMDDIADAIEKWLNDDMGDDLDGEDSDEEPEDLDTPEGGDCGPLPLGIECVPFVPIDSDEDGDPDNDGDEEDEDDLNFVSGFDPNAIYGPAGFTDVHYIQNNRRMDYTVSFENVDTATANVVEVRVNTLLDTAKFDISTFRYEAFGVGEQLYALAPFRNSFVSEVDQSSFENCLLRVTGNAPDSAGLVHVLFESLNLETRALIDNPDDGFLPPNVDAPFGEGYFVFSVMQKENQSHLTEFPMEAEIVFDALEPIVTEIYNNTIDAEAPESFITGTEATVADSVLVLYFNKQDMHSGVDFVDFYASSDGAAFEKRVRTNSDSLVVNLAYGVAYQFYTIATDFCGNVELAPDAPDVTVTYVVGIEESTIASSVNVYPVPSTDVLNCEVVMAKSAEVTIEFENMLGEKVNVGSTGQLTWQQGVGKFNRSFFINDLANGIYNLKITMDDQTISRRFVKQ